MCALQLIPLALMLPKLFEYDVHRCLIGCMKRNAFWGRNASSKVRMRLERDRGLCKSMLHLFDKI